MWKIVTRYLHSSFIIPFLVGLLASISFLLTFQLFKITKLVISKNVPFTPIIILIGNMILTFIPLATPLAILFATIYSLHHLAQDSEIIAMRASGSDLFTILLPYLGSGFIIGVLLFLLQSDFIPNSESRVNLQVTKLAKAGLLTDLNSQQFFTEIPGITLYADKVQSNGRVLHDVYIHLKEQGGGNLEQKDNSQERAKGEESDVLKGEQIIVAKEGEILGGEDQNSGLRMKLTIGNILKIKVDHDKHKVFDLEKIIFEEYYLPLNQNKYTEQLGNSKNSMRTTIELLQINFLKHIPNSWLKGDETFLKKEKKKSEIEFYSRLNNFFLCPLFSFLGMTLGVQRPRGKNQSILLISFIVLVSYYGLYFTGISLAKGFKVPSYLAILIPSLLLFTVGVFFYRRLRWH